MPSDLKRLTAEFRVSTRGEAEIIDIAGRVAEAVKAARVAEGKALVKDPGEAFERLAPAD